MIPPRFFVSFVFIPNQGFHIIVGAKDPLPLLFLVADVTR